MKKLLLACMLCATSLSPALAAGPYVGLGVNISDAEGRKNTMATLKLRGGYDFTDTWGIEAGIMGVPQFDAYDRGFYPLGRASGRTMYAAGKATMPINDKFSLVTKLGVAHTRLKFDDTSLMGAGAFDKSYTTGLYAAIGLKYALTEKTSLTLEFERMGRTSRHVNGGVRPESVSLNLNYSF